jgi:nitrate reductase assembly molybdenum cofactor insertion protein NarJ
LYGGIRNSRGVPEKWDEFLQVVGPKLESKPTFWNLLKGRTYSKLSHHIHTKYDMRLIATSVKRIQDKKIRDAYIEMFDYMEKRTIFITKHTQGPN